MHTIYSVSKWLDYLFNVWPFKTSKFPPTEIEICQNRFNIWQNTKNPRKLAGL